MSEQNAGKGTCLEQFFYGTVTVGERGQVVVPAKARRDFGIETGDHLLILGHPTKNGLMLCKVDAIRSFLTNMIENLDSIEAAAVSSTSEQEEA